VSPEARIKKVIPLVIPLRKKRKNIEESTAHSPFLGKELPTSRYGYRPVAYNHWAVF